MKKQRNIVLLGVILSLIIGLWGCQRDTASPNTLLEEALDSLSEILAEDLSGISLTVYNLGNVSTNPLNKDELISMMERWFPEKIVKLSGNDLTQIADLLQRVADEKYNPIQSDRSLVDIRFCLVFENSKGKEVVEIYGFGFNEASANEVTDWTMYINGVGVDFNSTLYDLVDYCMQ